MKVKVELKNGKVIEVLPGEVEVLNKAGLLKEAKEKSVTKEEKEAGETKSFKEEKEALERMYPKSNRPVNISTANVKGGRPKKVK